MEAEEDAAVEAEDATAEDATEDIDVDAAAEYADAAKAQGQQILKQRQQRQQRQ